MAEEIYTPLGEEYTPMEPEVQSRAPEQAASELAGLALTLDQDDFTDPSSKYAIAKQQLMMDGRSDLVDKVVTDTANLQRAADVEGLRSILADDSVTAEIKARVLESFGEQAQIVPDVQGEQIDRYGAANPEMNYDGIEAARASEQRAFEMIDERLMELADGADLGDIVDFGGMMLPFNESGTVSKAIELAFPEASTWDEYSSYAFLGGAKEEMVALFEATPRSEWPSKVEVMIQAIRDEAGYFGGNEMIETMILMDVVDKLRGTVETQGPDAFEVVDNISSVLDLTVVGGAAVRGFKGAGKLAKGTNLSRLSKANPRAAGEVVAGGIVDPETAKAAGTTQGNLGVRAFIPKQKTDGTIEWIEDVPPAKVDGVREQMAAGVKRAMDEVDQAKTTTQAERQAAQVARENEVNAMNGVKFSLNNSLVEVVGDKIRTTLKFMSATGKHFESAQAAMDAARAAFPAATQVGIEAIRIGTNVITNVKNIYNEAEVITRSLKDRAGDLIAKASKGRASLSAEEAEALKKELKAIDEALVQIDNQKRSKEGTVAKKELLQAKKIVEAKLKAGAKAKGESKELKALKEDLARIESGETKGFKNPELNKLAEDLAKPVKTEEIKDTLPKYGYVAKVETIQDPSEVTKLMFGTTGWMDRVPDILKPFATWLAPPSSLFDRALTRFADRAFDRSGVITRDLREMARPFLNLSRDEQVKVVEALAKGDVEGKVYDAIDLAARFGIRDEATRDGYYSWRRLEDGLWAVKDHELARKLMADGNKWIEINGTKWAAKPKTRESVEAWIGQTGKPRKVYDAESGAVLNIDAKLIKDIYEQGGFIAKSDRAVDQGKDRLSYIIVRRNHQVDNVPSAGVLNKIEGHVTRFYDETYYITRTVNGRLDGASEAELIKVLNTAGTREEAEQLVKQLQANATDGAVYKWRHDRRLSHQEKLDMQRSLDETTGHYKHLARGEHKRNSAGTKADILNPVESMDRAIQAASRTVTIDRMIGDMKQRWINSYGHLTNGKFPNDPRQISNEGIVNNPEMGKAIAGMNWIRTMEGQKSTFDTFWEQAWLSLSEQFGNAKLAKAIRGVGENANPVQLLRGTAFTLFIVFNPIRQLALQTSQILFLSALDPKYFATGKVISDASALAMAHRVVRGVSEDTGAFKRLAKSLGVSEDEAKAIAKAYDESGFYDSVDAHSFTRDGMALIGREVGRNNLSQFGATMQYGWNRFKTGIRAVGFDAGERANLLMTWNLARRQYLQKNPGANIRSREVQDAIATDARGLALSMQQSGELSYQKGILSLATQFWSVQHKAFLAMLTDESFTKAQKQRIAAGQFLLWGSAGFGLSEAYTSLRDSMGVQPNEAVDDFMTGGLVEAALQNMFFEGEFDVAGSLAPAGGFFDVVGNSMASVIEGDKSTLELFMGASGSAINKISDSVSSIKLLMQDPNIGLVDKALGSAHNFVNMSSGVSNFTKMMMAMNLKAHIDSTGDPIAEATFSELVAKGVFGFQPESVKEYYKILNKAGGKSPQEEVDKEATRVINYVKNDLLQRVYPMTFDWGSDSVHERQDKMQSELLKRFDEVIALSIALYDKDFGLAVQTKIREKLVNEWRKPETRSESLIAQIVQNARKGTTGKPIEDTRILIENSNLPENDKAAYLRLLEESYDNRERQLEGRGFN